MNKEIISTQSAPQPIGAYSQAVKAGNMVFVSGQIALDPQTNQMANASFEQELEQVFANLEAVIHASGATFAHVVKFTIYLIELSLFSHVNDYMQKILEQPFPARVTVGVASLPKNAQIEIDAILFI